MPSLISGVDWGTTLSQTMMIVRWLGFIMGLVIAAFIVILISLYKHQILIYDNGVWYKDKARKIKKGMISTFELKSSMLKPKKNKEIFMIPHNLIQRVGKGKIIMIEKLADGIYYPISKETNNLNLKITPQKLNWLLERTRKIADRYKENKWYEAAWVTPAAMMIVGIIYFMSIVMVLDRVEGVTVSVGTACREAESNILDTVRQKITP